MSEQIDDVLRKGFEEFQQFVNPLIAQRAKLTGEPISFVSVEDGMLVDTDGNRVEDFHGTQMLGHRHPAITAAAKAFLDSPSPNWFPSRVNPWAGRLARRLCERSGYSNVFFGLTGADGVEASMKLARALTRRPRFVALEGGYHGCSFGAVSLMHRGPFTEPFEPLLPGVIRVPFGDVAALEAALAPGDVAAAIVEPIQGEGGVRELPSAFVDALCTLTARHGTVLVADETQTGLGRTGVFLRSSRWPRRPEVAILAKTIGGGLMPISAMLTRRELFEKAYGQNFEEGEAHNTTFSYNGLSCAAAYASLDLISDAAMARAAELGAAFKREVSAALSRSPLFVEARGQGFMLGVKLSQPDHPWLSFEHFGYPELALHPTVGPLLAHRLYKRGFFCFVCGHDWSILRLQPRFDIPAERLSALVKAIAEELAYLEGLAS